ncbi:hypothetical protein ACMWP2_03870 [Helicobacter pylori]
MDINVGFKDEATKNYFLTSSEITNAKDEYTKKHPLDSRAATLVEDKNTKDFFFELSSTPLTVTSTKDYTATSNKVVVAEVVVRNDQSASDSDTKGVLRVLYFLPSVIEVEY